MTRRLFLLGICLAWLVICASTFAASDHLRIVLAGDSTVSETDGWGPGFAHCLATNVECLNLARNGRSSKSFIAEGLWSNCIAAKPDYVLIQFGHNDQPGHGDRQTDPQTTYRQFMNQYVDEARAAGIKPVLITSLSRRQWGKDDGKIHSTLVPWVDVVKQIAAEKNVPLIDLHARSIELYEKLGMEKVLELSPRKNPDVTSTNLDTYAKTNGYDATHLTAKGSEVIGPIVAAELAKVVPELNPYLHGPVPVGGPIPPGVDCVVALDGSGTFTNVQAAVKAAPANANQPYVIYLKPGTYTGHVSIPPDKPYLTFRGQSATNTVITDNKNIFAVDSDGVKIGTQESSTVYVRGDNFSAEGISFENTAGNHGQALAMFVNADRAVFNRCRFLGWQDTLRADNSHGTAGRQYYADCDIVGHVDFIYGAGTAVFNRCHIHSLADGYLTAASTPESNDFGYVFLHCRITAESTVKGIYLGRPWRPYAKVVYLDTEMPAQIRPTGWDNWKNPDNEATAFYAEYHSVGPGAQPDKRVKWSHQLTDDQAKAYTVGNILRGKDDWNPEAR